MNCWESWAFHRHRNPDVGGAVRDRLQPNDAQRPAPPSRRPKIINPPRSLWR